MLTKRDVVLVIFVVVLFSTGVYASLVNPVRPAVDPQAEAERARLMREHEEQIARDLGARWQQFQQRTARVELKNIHAVRQVGVSGYQESGERCEVGW